MCFRFYPSIFSYSSLVAVFSIFFLKKDKKEKSAIGKQKYLFHSTSIYELAE